MRHLRAVWLSSTYYLDPAVEGLSGNAERLFTRALAYCGNAETSGYVSAAAIKKLGLPSPARLAKELVAARIWVERTGGGWDFRSWGAWNSKGDLLLDRRRSDRERQAKKRAREKASRDVDSRDLSRDVTPPEESREQKRDNVSEAAHDSNATEPDSPPRGPAVDMPGWKLVRAVIPDRHPTAVRTELAMQAGALLKSGTPADDVEAALRLWLDKRVGPKVLPSLVSDVIKARDRPGGNLPARRTDRRSTTDERVAETLDMAAKYEAGELE